MANSVKDNYFSKVMNQVSKYYPGCSSIEVVASGGQCWNPCM